MLTGMLLLASPGPVAAVLYSWNPAAATDDWSTADNWIPNTGIPMNNADQATIADGGVVRIDLGALDLIGMLTVGSGGTTGTATVVSGTILDVNRTGGGGGGVERVRVGIGAGSIGHLIVEEGAEITTRGAAVFTQIGSSDGGVGNLTVAGTFAPYKAFRLINGTLTMLPTGNTISSFGNTFNSADPSSISADGTLAFEIDGTSNGLLDLRTQLPGGSPLTIDPAANLKINLLGDLSAYSIGQQWTLVSWDASLTGQFSQGTSFTSDEGHTFSVDYAGGATGKDIVLSLDGISGSGPPPFAFTDIAMDIEAGTVTATWNSKPGRTYAIDSSVDLATGSWREQNDSIPSSGTSTSTTLPLPADTPRLFLRVYEIDP